MKLKKILASLTAAAMAVTTMAFAPVSVSAAAVSTKPAGTEEVIAKIENYTASATGMWSGLGCANSDWTVDISSYMTDPNAYVKLVASVTESADYGISEFTNWAYPVKWYVTDVYEVGFIGTSDSTLDNFVSYVPLSDFKLVMSDGSTHASSMQGNVQVGFAGSVNISEFSIVKFTVGDPVPPTADVPLGTLTGGGSTTIYEESWGLAGNNWTSNFYSNIAAEATSANYTAPAEYMNEFAGILYEVNVSSASTPVKYGSLQAQPFGSTSSYAWISGDKSVVIDNGTDKYYVYMDMSLLPSTNTYAQIGIQLIDDANFNTIGQTANISYSVSATLLKNAPTLNIPETLALKRGDSDTLSATTVPAALASAVKWSSDDDTVASVDSATGEVTAVAKGNAVITADIKSVGLSDTCAVSVADKVDSVTVTPATAELYIGETAELTATVSPEGAGEVTWSTSDAKVATVKDGVVTAVAKGTATITAKAGDKSAKCVVTVKSVTESITVTPATAEVVVGKTVKLTATVTPADSDQAVTWSTSDAKVATVKDGVVTAVAKGTATITAVSGKKSAKCVVTVKSVTEKIEVTPKTAKLFVGETAELTATVTPADSDDEITWTSSDSKIASVKDGVVTAVAPGTATITVTSGTKSDTCVVTVAKKTYAVTVSSNDETMGTAKADLTEAAEGDTVTLTADPKEGFRFVKWETTGVTLDAEDITSENAMFSMPSSAVSAIAYFEEIPAGEHAVTIKSSVGGTASADYKSAIADTVVTLTFKAATGYEFDKWLVTPETVVITNNKFTMPDEAVTITPVFKKISYNVTVADTANGTVTADKTTAQMGDTVTVTATPDDGYALESISVNGEAIEGNTFVMPAEDVEITAVFARDTYTISTETVKGGVYSVDKTSAKIGETVTVTATPDAGYALVSITVNGTAIEGNTFVMPAEDVVVIAVFERDTFTVSTETVSGGVYSVDKTSAKAGETVTVTATPDVGYSLVSITVNGKVISGNTFEMPAEDVVVIAVFEKTGFAVTVSAPVGGTLVVDKANAHAGDTITVTATPDAGYELVEITVNGKAITGNTFVMPAEDVVVSAVFKKLPGSADAVVETPAGIDVEFEGSKEDILASVFGDDYNTLIANGAVLDVVMTVKDENEVSDEDKALINGILTDDMNVGLFLNIELFKTVDGVRTQLTSSIKPISFRISVPAGIIAENRNYYAARVHDGEAKIISDAFNSSSNTISVSSDKFSTFAIVYEDKPEEIIQPEPVILYSIVTDSHSSVNVYKAAAGTVISVKTEFGYDAEVYCNGTKITSISDNGTFIMPKGNVKIVSVDNGYIGAMRRALPNSYIFVYDSEMNYIKTNGSTRGINGTGKITVKLGSEYAGKTITLYKGRKSTEVKLASMILDEDGYATFTVSAGMNYTAVVE